MIKSLKIACLVFISLKVNAQIPFSTLDSLASQIRNIQLTASDKSFNDNGVTYKVSFAEDNFGILLNNKRAYASVYKLFGQKEKLEIIEDIDLSKVSALERISLADGSGFVKLSFPKGVLKCLILEDGVEQKRAKEQIELFTGGNVKHLYAVVAQLVSYSKEGNGEFKSIEQQWIRLQNTPYPEGLNSVTLFLKQYPNTVYSAEAQKLLEAYSKRKAYEDARKKEIAAAIENIYAIADRASTSYRFYEDYNTANSATTTLLDKYSSAEIGHLHSNLYSFKNDLSERYKWNKEYYLKRDKILQYDAMTAQAAAFSNDYIRKANGSVNVLKVGMLTLGGIATLLGAYATLAKDDSFSSKDRSNLFKYGGATLGVGLTWTILEGSAVKRAKKRYQTAQNNADELKAIIGEVLNKRHEMKDGRPIININ